MKKDNSKKIQELYCVVADDGDEFDIPTRGELGNHEVAVGTDIADLVNNVEEEAWDINDKLVVYKLVPVGYIARGKLAFNKLGEKSS